MKIENIKIFAQRLGLNKIFRTSLRETDSISELVVIIETDVGIEGKGSACDCSAITGETVPGIREAIVNKIFPVIKGMDIRLHERIFFKIQNAIAYNNAAKAAVDMAVYDLLSQYLKIPLFQLLGGYKDYLRTDITLSLDTPEKMAHEAIQVGNEGFSILKIKAGGLNPKEDIERVKKIRDAVGDGVKLRIDANQAWKPRDAVKIINKLEKYDIELIEQPNAYWDTKGLKWISQRTNIPIMADESIFTNHDAFKLLSDNVVDCLNIKLLKCGGINEAVKIINIAETAGIECMMGCMMEGGISIAYAIYLAAAKQNITKVDLDSPLFLETMDPMPYIHYQAPQILLNSTV